MTEIAYHKKKTIDGDVSFLTEQEWRDELKVLLDDLVDEDGHVKRSTDLRSDAGIAWSKVSFIPEQMVGVSHDVDMSAPTGPCGVPIHFARAAGAAECRPNHRARP